MSKSDYFLLVGTVCLAPHIDALFGVPLGVVCLVIGLAALWKADQQPNS